VLLGAVCNRPHASHGQSIEALTLNLTPTQLNEANRKPTTKH